MAGRSRTASRFAVIDVGSNTVHLLVADCDGKTVAAIDDESTRLRMGEEVALRGALDRDKIKLAVQTVRSYVVRAHQQRAGQVCLIGTQAVRVASNGKDLVEAVEKATDLRLQVVEPGLEARLGFLGTTLDVPDKRPRLIVDIGGGSTQLLLANGKNSPHFDQSLPIGSVALPARFLRTDPPRKNEREHLELAVEQAVGSVNQQARPGAVQPEYGIVVGGIGRRLARAGRLAPGEPLVRLWIERLADVALSVGSEVMEVLGSARIDDVDMIRAGAVILREVMTAYRLQYCLVSSYGIREGAILALAREEKFFHVD
jgi:exopolyphosphatase / guanosine-5'-triphosphate,3'-diphosphate pyrophosphatase